MTIAYHQQHAAHDAAQINNLKRVAANVIAFAAFCLLMLSLRPFHSVGRTNLEPQLGDSVNQIGFLIAGTIAAVALTTLVNHRLLRIFVAPGWIGIFVVLAISIAVAPVEATALRSVALTLIGMLVASCIVLLPPDERSFQRVCASAILVVLAVSYVGVTIAPELAVHGSDGSEGQHVGLWRGHFNHKNIAGPVMSVFVMFGIYLWRSRYRVIGPAITVLALIFVIQTGSKTTNGLLPIAILAVLVGRALALPLLTIALYVAATLALGLLTLGTLYSPALADFTKALLADPSFTGRVTLWAHGIENIPAQPLFGTGFDGYWGTPAVTQMEKPFDSEWDFRAIVHGHSNFIDMALTTGLFGFVILMWALFVAPSVNFVKSYRLPGNRNLADLFMMIIVFLTLLSFLETFFLRRVDPIWLTWVIAIVGLQLTSRYRAV